MMRHRRVPTITGLISLIPGLLLMTAPVAAAAPEADVSQNAESAASANGIDPQEGNAKMVTSGTFPESADDRARPSAHSQIGEFVVVVAIEASLHRRTNGSEAENRPKSRSSFRPSGEAVPMGEWLEVCENLIVGGMTDAMNYRKVETWLRVASPLNGCTSVDEARWIPFKIADECGDHLIVAYARPRASDFFTHYHDATDIPALCLNRYQARGSHAKSQWRDDKIGTLKSIALVLPCIRANLAGTVAESFPPADASQMVRSIGGYLAESAERTFYDHAELSDALLRALPDTGLRAALGTGVASAMVGVATCVIIDLCQGVLCDDPVRLNL